MSAIPPGSDLPDETDAGALPVIGSKGTPWTQGALVGGLAALIASGVMLWIGRQWGGAILAQILAERIIEVTPLSVFRRALAALEADAKPMTLLGLTIVQVAAGALLGALYARRWAAAGLARRIGGGIGLALLIWFFLGLIAAPLGNLGTFARNSAEAGITQVAFALTALIFGAGVALFVPWPSYQRGVDASRRRFVQTAGVTSLALPALLASGYLGRYLRQMRNAYDPGLSIIAADGEGDFEFAGMPEEITPVGAFYTVSKNLIDPTVDTSGWSLEVNGLVERPMSLSYTDLLLRDSSAITATLECISNPVGGQYISNAVWKGFPLSELLDEAGLLPGIVDLELHAADGYVESIPIEKAMDDVMLVHTMNDEPLTDKHGYPVRMIVPGIYGMKNVKWVTAMVAVNEDIQGYWQKRGWSDIATILPMSRIDVPAKAYKAVPGETVRIGGVAFGGDQSISRVELSLDDGVTWHDTRLSPLLSANAWRLWSYEYAADEPGIRRMVVRATNGAGERQDETEREPLPDGSTGWHCEWFEVLEA
jgi:DMSO/TMAO reductase YedYZ molybdopterin-dependent catalytic subunit